MDDSRDYGIFVIKGAKFLMLDLSIILVKQDLMEFYWRKLTYDLYTQAKKKIALNAVSDIEYIDV